MMSSADRFTLTTDQLVQYFDRIALPQSKRIFDASNLAGDHQLEYLSTLLKHHQVRIPFENLTQHYSWHRVIDVTPLHVFRKVMNQPGRGGYCMEINLLLHTLLLSLGFNCYTAAGRVWEPPRKQWTGWTHMVNFVTIDGVKYLCDAGFGPQEPTVPIPLKHGEIRQQVSPAQSRLMYASLEQNLSDCKVWIYQFRYCEGAEWLPMYCFTELEILPTDLPAMNYAPWLSRSIVFTQKVICVRFTTSAEDIESNMVNEELIDSGEVDGILIIDHDKLKWRRNGKIAMEIEFKSEAERVDALKSYWGIELDVEDRNAIVGTTSAVGSRE